MTNAFVSDNLIFLQEHYPSIYEFIRNLDYSKENYQIRPSKSGWNILHIQHESGTEYSLYSRYDPKLESSKWVESLGDSILSADHVLMIGFGFGYHLEAFLEMFPDKRFYIYEPEVEYFLAATHAVDLEPVLNHKQVALFSVGNDPLIQSQTANAICNAIKGSFAYCVLPYHRKWHADVVGQFEQILHQELLKIRANIATFNRFQEEWLENIILNVKHNLKSASFAAMKNTCTGIPAVIVGSGPSLSMEIEHLKTLKGRAVIITAGSSIQALIKHGIEPDLAVSFDGSAANYDVFKHLDLQEIPFLYTPMIKHQILQKPMKYLTHAYLSTDSMTSYLMGVSVTDPIFISTSTVTGIAIQAALYLDCSEIVFIGQDFSYPNDVFYADGVSHVDQEELNKRITNSDQFVENVCGGMNRTNKSMMVLKDSVEQVIEIFANYPFYNASPVGAVIRNTKPKTLVELIRQTDSTKRDKDWFKSMVAERRLLYPEEKVKNVINRVEQILNSLDEVHVSALQLKDHFTENMVTSLTDASQLKEWFRILDEQWNPIVESDMYLYFYSFVLFNEINSMKRFLVDLPQETDLTRRAEIIKNAVYPVVQEMLRIHPVVKHNLETLLKNLSVERASSYE
mgnify:CR=1 FL=1